MYLHGSADGCKTQKRVFIPSRIPFQGMVPPTVDRASQFNSSTQNNPPVMPREMTISPK